MNARLLQIRIITGVVLALALLLIVRLYFVQVMEGKAYQGKAEEQYVRSVKGLFDRGAIYFTTKDGQQVSAATLKVGYTLAVAPDQMTDPAEAYEKLKEFIPLPREVFMARANKKGDPYEEIATHVEEENATKIRSFKLPGVNLFRDQWRYYPGDSLASHAIGFVAYDGDSLEGQYGLERSYNTILSRTSGDLFVNFFAELFGNFQTIVFDSKEEHEGHIVTSLEPTVVRALESTVRGVQDQWSSAETGGIIMNPQTGQVYAISAFPDFNLNNFRNVSNPQDYQNPLIENVYEMGSIIKPLTVAAGLDSGVINRYSTYNDTGHIDIDGYKISNYDGVARGVVPIQQILSQSLNVGVAHIVKIMGHASFRKYFKALKLEHTGIDLPNEGAGLTKNLESPRDVEYATASFGQGIALTPIATARALSSLGNGGYLVTPHVVDKIIYENGKEEAVQYPEKERVFKEETSEEITRMLVEVVDKALAGGTVKLDRYTIAAKTGTAQIARADGKGYYDDRYLHSFFGYFPAYNPQFLIFLYTVEPKHVNYASQTLTTPFMDLAKFLLNYYNVPPDR